MTYARISGTGSVLPDKVLTNADLEEMVDTSDEWIRDRTGIKKRHVVDGETTCDIAEVASRRAIEAAGIKPQDIDLIIVATTTPDRIFPSTACLLQDRLDIHGCPAFDVQAVCTGFIYALGVADLFVTSGKAKHALVVGAETLSNIIDWTDRSTCVLFGDGAGAVVLSASEEAGILSTHLHADGKYKELLTVPSGISENFEQLKAGEAYVQMKGNEVFKMAVNTLGRIVDETLASDIALHLDLFMMDLIGDGWTVIRHDVPRGNNTDVIANLKAARKLLTKIKWIASRFFAAQNSKNIFEKFHSSRV